MSKFNSILKKCLNCNKKFWVWPARIKKGRGKYCSKKCMNESPIFAEQIRQANKKYLHGFRKGQKAWNVEKKNSWCAFENHWNWKGGIWHDSDGYIWLLRKNHLWANKYGYVLRSHLIAEKSLNRLIQRGEIIHHINGIRNDDKPENLYLFASAKEHRKYHTSKVKSELTTNLL